MRRILSSLFVILAIVSVGVFATGAFFTDTVGTTNQTFTTGSADLKFGQCGEIGADCSNVPANIDTYSVPGSELTGPGVQNSGCLVVQNTGQYSLNLSSTVDVTAYSHPDMATYFEVAADVANSSCYAASTLMAWQSAAAAEAASPLALGITLAPAQRLYLVLYNRWNSTGDQNYLQNGSITLDTSLIGQTQ